MKEQASKLAFIAIAILFSLSVGSSSAQSVSEPSTKWREGWMVGGAYHTGVMMEHHSHMSILNEKKPWLAELYVVKQTDGSKAWHSFFGYPDIGVKLTVMELGSPTYIGKSYSLHPFLKFSLVDKRKRLVPSITAAAGPAYVEKTFDRHTNYKNTAIGSHINAFLQLQFDLNIRIVDNVHAHAGFALSHLSNGSFKKPNAGVNILTAKLGASYTFGEVERQASKPIELASPSEKKWNYHLVLTGGLKEVSPIGSGKYGVGSFSFESSLKHLAYTRVSGSFDVFYDGSNYDSFYYELDNKGKTISRLQTVKLGLALGYELIFGKVSANIQVGAYLYAKQKEDGILYQRTTLRYMPINRFGVQLGLKSHGGVADYIELGCIYKLR